MATPLVKPAFLHQMIPTTENIATPMLIASETYEGNSLMMLHYTTPMWHHMMSYDVKWCHMMSHIINTLNVSFTLSFIRWCFLPCMLYDQWWYRYSVQWDHSLQRIKLIILYPLQAGRLKKNHCLKVTMERMKVLQWFWYRIVGYFWSRNFCTTTKNGISKFYFRTVEGTRENFGGEKIGKFGESWAVHQNFPHQYSQIHRKHIWHMHWL